MNLTVILDLITAREATAGQTADRLREQITALTTDLARVEGELAALATTRTTLSALTAAEFTADDPTIASAPYQQILDVLTTASAGMRAKAICVALDVEPSPNHVESIRAKLKRMVHRNVLTEDEPGVFTLASKRT
ncbi:MULTISPECIES: hypothetical protein [Micromonospora]|uniref:Uncharacterized protein n=1 Tax=Micromonospora haikouensis TaxID=686309 RepID=A0A0D0V1T5_9ACTN|nr:MULTISPECIES: hypothetical protein [Micromonospora]KIR64932.1 hypothetical protein TK50_05090 [Micromonospora haikouensis]